MLANLAGLLSPNLVEDSLESRKSRTVIGAIWKVGVRKKQSEADRIRCIDETGSIALVV